ncbi:MAG: NnrU family protein [Nannocystaceae bacterium]
MGAVPTTAALLAAFVLSHLVITTPPVRTIIVDRLGRVRLAVIASVLAWATLAPLIWLYAAHRGEGPPGLGLGHLLGVRWPAMAAMVAGMVLMVAIVAPSGYPASAAAVFSRHSREPRGLERITRHPFFVGLVLWGLGHTLVAERLVGVIVFGGLALMGGAGALLQDRKLLGLRGREHAEYLRATSIVPLWAVLRGRQRVVLRELPWAFVGLGAAAAAGTRWLHGRGFAYGWLVLLLVMVVVPLWLGVSSAFRHHRARSSGPATSPHQHQDRRHDRRPSSATPTDDR